MGDPLSHIIADTILDKIYSTKVFPTHTAKNKSMTAFSLKITNIHMTYLTQSTPTTENSN